MLFFRYGGANMSENTNSVKPTSIRIPDDLKKELEKIASSQSRSFNNLVNIVLREYVSNHSES